MARRPRKSVPHAAESIDCPRYAPAPAHTQVEGPNRPQPVLAPDASPPTAILRVHDTWFQVPAALVPTLLAEISSHFPLRDDGSPGDRIEVVDSAMSLYLLILRERERHRAENYRGRETIRLPVHMRSRVSVAELIASRPAEEGEPFRQTPEMFLAQGRALLAREQADAEARRLAAFREAAERPASDPSTPSPAEAAILRIPRRKLPPHLD